MQVDGDTGAAGSAGRGGGGADRFAHEAAVAGWASVGVVWPPPRGRTPVDERPALDDSAWLDEDQERSWAALAATMSLLPAALDAQLRRDAGMSLVEFRALSWLAAVPRHSARMTVLAEAVAISQSHATRVVARLEDRRFVRRKTGSDDRRGTVAVLTETGWDAVVAATPEHVATVRRLVFGNLWFDQTVQLERFCRAVLEVLRPGQGLRVTGKPTAFR